MGKNAPATTPALFSAVDAYHGRELVDQLRELGLDRYVELPQIAVMGDTSSGKSSLLSALSGVSFPSSHKLTTRCPTQLILSRAPVFAGKVRLHRFHAGHSEHEGEIESMDDVPRAIEELTQLLVGEGQHISDDEIIIELRGPALPNLTLTDLPGLVRAVGDKEDKSIIPRVRDMVHRYMEQERTIIMAVVPANVDMHNVEVLQDAQEADPSGERTIAVVTKLDLVDTGAESGVDDLLRNRKKELKLGYHAVKCRGQQDLDRGVDVAEGLQHELAFFRNHAYWSKLDRTSWGMAELTKKLVDIMQRNIINTMPAVTKDIQEQMDAATTQLKALGTPMDSPVVRRQAFGQYVERFLAPMQAVLKGDYDALASSNLVDDEGVDVRLRAQIRLCDEAFKDQIQATEQKMPGRNSDAPLAPGDLIQVDVNGVRKSFCVDQVRAGGDVKCTAYQPDEWLGSSRYTPHPLNHLRRFIIENRGDELAIFPPYTVFCSILRQWIDTWEVPMLALVQKYRTLTLAVAKRIVHDLDAPKAVNRFFEERANAAMGELREAAETELKRELARERRPYTQNSDLLKAYTDMLRPGLESLLHQHLTLDEDNRADFGQFVTVFTDLANAHDEHDTVVMDCGLRAYFAAAMTRFVDVVPMRLNDLVLEQFVARMREELQSATDDKLEKLLNESDRTRTRREDFETKVATLRAAKDKIEELVM